QQASLALRSVCGVCTKTRPLSGIRHRTLSVYKNVQSSPRPLREWLAAVASWDRQPIRWWIWSDSTRAAPDVGFFGGEGRLMLSDVHK
ncbi:hypothetical protein GDO78_021524, partial [Eleutherodactylus coqui]